MAKMRIGGEEYPHLAPIFKGLETKNKIAQTAPSVNPHRRRLLKRWRNKHLTIILIGYKVRVAP
jgi:hypothetical protein